MSFEDRLRALRIAKNMTQSSIADALGIDRSRYVKWECGKARPSYESIIQICDYFKISADYILGITDDPTPHDGTVDRTAAAELIASGEAPEITEEQLMERLPEDIRDTVMALIKIEVEKMKKQ